jgi:protein SCO1/2
MKPKTRLLIAVILALVAAGGVTAGALFLAGGRAGMTASGTALIGGPFSLIAADGSAVSDRTYRGKWQIIYFGYTYCPDACPVALTKLSLALEKLGADASKLQALFITIDPERDTQQALSEYLKSFDSRIVGLTGSKAQIDDVAKEFRVYVAPQKSSDSKDYVVDHSAYFYLMDPRGDFVNVLAPDLSGEAIADRLRKEMSLSSLWGGK